MYGIWGCIIICWNTDETYNKIVQDIKEYIADNYYRDITLNELSEKYFVSISCLSKIFKKVTGTNFRKYLYSFRINEAKNKLAAGKIKSIEEVCSKVGFNDVCYFYRVFNKMEGMTPTDYILSMNAGLRKIV